MIEQSRPKGCIDEDEFGYHAGMDGYPNSSSDMNELSEIANPAMEVKNGED